MINSVKTVLAIESAISGGSISLIEDNVEVANWIGTSNVSKAEDLLANIDLILTANGVSRRALDLIAVSAGPGSFTGIRIGVATALGLKAGLGIAMSSESALKAMVFVQGSLAPVIAAVPTGRNAVCLQELQRSEAGVADACEPRTMIESEFLSFIESKKDGMVVLHSALYEKVEPSANIINFGPNLAYAVGQICRENAGVVTEPLFISKSF